jgi:mitogen-activated protein kinase kinase kinase
VNLINVTFADILLDHLGVIKFVDFGAAKILAKNQRTIQRSRRAADMVASPNGTPSFNGLAMNNSLTGTPMYMSPEIIKNDKRGRHGAMDIWSLGCVVLEFATGKKPWSNLDNEWCA